MRPSSWLATLVALLLLGIHCLRWQGYISDDAFISLRYADRLLSGHGLTWTAGPPVEGYSNLLWVLLVAFLGSLGMGLVDATRLLGLACSLGVVAVLGLHLGRRSAAGAWVAGLAVASSSSIALWAFGGLEQPLLALLLAWALVGLGEGLGTAEGAVDHRKVWGPAIALSLACWTRPDTPVLVATLGLGWFLASGQDRKALRSTLLLVGLPFLATMLQLLLRLALYDDYLPNTARVKIRPSEAHTDAGAIWTWQALQTHGPLLLLAGLALLAWPKGEPIRGRLRLALPVLLGWCAWTVWIGGDIFPAFRHFAPMVVLLAWLAGSAVTGLAQRSAGLGLAGALVATLLLGWMGPKQAAHPVVQRAHNEGWVLHGVEVGRTLARAFPTQQPKVAVSPAGAIPYASRLPSLDMLGLNDRHIARQESSGAGWIGHELGDGDYVFAAAPDIVFFCGPKGSENPCFPSEIELAARPDFRATYGRVSWATAGGDGLRFSPWVRREGRIGARQLADPQAIPGWLLSELGGVARPGEDGRLRLHLAPGEVAGTAALRLLPGRWRLSPVPGLSMRLVGPQLRADGDAWLQGEEGLVRLELEAQADLVLDAIRLEPAW